MSNDNGDSEPLVCNVCQEVYVPDNHDGGDAPDGICGECAFDADYSEYEQSN